jgi:translation initiation factor 3 subunit M
MVRAPLYLSGSSGLLIPNLVIRAGLSWGKMSQTDQTIHVVRSSARVFEQEQWAALEKRVLAWKTSLAGVLEVINVAKRQGGLVPAQVA